MIAMTIRVSRRVGMLETRQTAVVKARDGGNWDIEGARKYYAWCRLLMGKARKPNRVTKGERIVAKTRERERKKGESVDDDGAGL